MKRMTLVVWLVALIGCTEPADIIEPEPEVEDVVLPVCSPEMPSQRVVGVIAPAMRDRRDYDYGESLAVYSPSEFKVVDCMLTLAGVNENDVVIDLGSGDGRIVIAAAMRGARGIGVDYNPERIAEANTNAEASGVQDLVTFIEGDIRDADLSEATVVTLYLGPEGNRAVLPLITRDLDPGDRVVSHDYGFRGWPADQTVHLRPHTIRLWEIYEHVSLPD